MVGPGGSQHLAEGDSHFAVGQGGSQRPAGAGNPLAAGLVGSHLPAVVGSHLELEDIHPVGLVDNHPLVQVPMDNPQVLVDSQPVAAGLR